MSAKKKEECQVVSNSKFSIVRKIAALLKLGDEGKMDSFIERVVRTLNKEIAALTRNMSARKINNTQELEDHKDELEDAQQELADSYLAVSPEQVATNEKQKDFVDTYLAGIAAAKRKVTSIERAIEKSKERLKDETAEDQAQIDTLKATIASLVVNADKV